MTRLFSCPVGSGLQVTRLPKASGTLALSFFTAHWTQAGVSQVTFSSSAPSFERHTLAHKWHTEFCSVPPQSFDEVPTVLHHDLGLSLPGVVNVTADITVMSLHPPSSGSLEGRRVQALTPRVSTG